MLTRHRVLVGAIQKKKWKKQLPINEFGLDKMAMGVPRIKKFIDEGKQGLTPETIWFSSDVGTNDSAKRDLVNLFDGIAVFETLKTDSTA